MARSKFIQGIADSFCFLADGWAPSGGTRIEADVTVVQGGSSIAINVEDIDDFCAALRKAGDRAVAIAEKDKARRLRKEK